MLPLSPFETIINDENIIHVMSNSSDYLLIDDVAFPASSYPLGGATPFKRRYEGTYDDAIALYAALREPMVDLLQKASQGDPGVRSFVLSFARGDDEPEDFLERYLAKKAQTRKNMEFRVGTKTEAAMRAPFAAVEKFTITVKTPPVDGDEYIPVAHHPIKGMGKMRYEVYAFCRSNEFHQLPAKPEYLDALAIRLQDMPAIVISLDFRHNTAEATIYVPPDLPAGGDG